MKPIVIFLVILSYNLSLFAQDKSPKIQFATSIHNFGEIKEEAGSVSYSFEFTNTGEVPLIINRVTTSCACTASDWPKEPILPGSKGTITATYNPQGRPGAINQRITVFSNTNPASSVLTLRGQVSPRPKTKQDIYRRRIGDLGLTNSHVSFGVVYINQAKTDTLRMYNFGNSPITVSFDQIPRHINVRANPNILEPEKEGEILFTYNSKGLNDWGYVVNRVRIQVDNKNLAGNQINITARLEEDFSNLTPDQMASAPQIEFSEIQKDFGNIEEGQTVEHEFIFKNTGKSDLIIRKIQASCGCTTVAPKVNVLKSGEQSSLAASFRTSGFTGRQSKTITVITNDPKNTNIVLRLMGTVNKAQ